MTRPRAGAPRQPLPSWRPRARGAVAVLCLWLAGPGAGAAAEQITAARYTQPTDRYAHAVLGDAIEWGALRLTLANGQQREAVLPQALVFEDLAPRLADLDGDGAPEVIVVESHRDLGARLAIWDASGRVTATPYIGRRHRWLAPVGAADLDGDGRVEIAYVDRPHLAKTLRVWRFDNGALTEIAQAPGLSNHKIGWDFIVGGIRQCDGLPEMVLADAAWSQVVAVRLDAMSKVHITPVAPYAGPPSVQRALHCGGGG